MEVVNEALLERQKAAEEHVLNRGIDKYRQALFEAREEGRYADTMPGRWLTSNFIEPVAVKIRAFVNDSVAGKPGPHAVGAAVLNRLSYDACAFIALRTIVNSVLDTKGRAEKHKVASRIRRELVPHKV